MDNNNTETGFSYTYSATEQTEIKRIREKYTPPTEIEDKMARLRRLDASVTGAATAVALVLGILGTLMLGAGMSLIMTELAQMLGIGKGAAVAIGVSLGILGGALASLAYPVYHAMVAARRKRIAPEIIRLTDELMK